MRGGTKRILKGRTEGEPIVDYGIVLLKNWIGALTVANLQ